MLFFEHRRQPLLARRLFYRRVARNLALAFGVVACSLAAGSAGYHRFAGLPWLDAFLNAAMILTGMGPVDPMVTNRAKIFASFYALFSGLVVLTTAGIILAPLVHRMLHSFHMAADSE